MIKTKSILNQTQYVTQRIRIIIFFHIFYLNCTRRKTMANCSASYCYSHETLITHRSILPIYFLLRFFSEFPQCKKWIKNNVALKCFWRRHIYTGWFIHRWIAKCRKHWLLWISKLFYFSFVIAKCVIYNKIK